MTGLRKTIQGRYQSVRTTLSNYWIFQQLEHYFHHPKLWYINRRSVARATCLGIFIAFLPVPFQMVIAAFFALWLRVNLPISVAWIFITNPVTMGPVFFFCYKLGTEILDTPELDGIENYDSHLQWILVQLPFIWKPLWAGSLITGTILAIIGYITVRLIWLIYIRSKRGNLLKLLAENKPKS